AARVLAPQAAGARTRGALRDEPDQAAAPLARRGVGAGAVVSCQLPTTLEALVLMVALSRLGAIQNPIIPILRHREVGFITRQVATQHFVVPGTWRGFDYTAMVHDACAAQSVDVIEIDLVGLADGSGFRLPVDDRS